MDYPTDHWEAEEGFDRPFGCDLEPTYAGEGEGHFRFGGESAAEMCSYDEPLYDEFYAEYEEDYRQEYQQMPLFPTKATTSCSNNFSQQRLPTSTPRYPMETGAPSSLRYPTPLDTDSYLPDNVSSGRNDTSSTSTDLYLRRSINSSRGFGKLRASSLNQQARMNVQLQQWEASLPGHHRQRQERLRSGGASSPAPPSRTMYIRGARPYPTPPTSPLAPSQPISLPPISSLSLPARRTYTPQTIEDFGEMEDIAARRRRREMSSYDYAY